MVYNQGRFETVTKGLERLDSEILQGLIQECLDLLGQKQTAQAFILLHQAKGMLDAAIGDIYKWDLVKEEYEGGAKPSDLARKYKLNINTIKKRITRENWVSTRKLDRELNKKLAVKQTFIIDCYRCEHKFKATSGHAKVCNRCQADHEMDKKAACK